MKVVTDAGVKPTPVPFRLHSQKEAPESAYVAVRYLDNWFYVDNADLLSKRVVLVLTLLFRLQAPEAPAIAPVLTVPTGK